MGEYGFKPPINTIEQIFVKSYENLTHLSVRNPDQFVSGEIHNHKKEWLRITEDNADNMSCSIQNWINIGIDVK